MGTGSFHAPIKGVRVVGFREKEIDNTEKYLDEKGLLK